MKVIIITGQTATGKTNLALKLAQQYHGRLINCDSRQIYKLLDVITGKDKPINQPILLYDIIDPKEYFSSYDYVQLAVPLIKKLLRNKITPIIVGGSYLYIKHLLYKIETEKIAPDWQLRKKLASFTVKNLQTILKRRNPQLFSQLNQSDLNNPQRLIRKIEIADTDSVNYLTKSKNHQIMLANKLKMNQVKIDMIGLKFDNKTILAKTIKQRVKERIKQGAILEVKKLLERGYDEDDPGLKSLGYQQIIHYLKGTITKKEAVNQWITKEIQYAKRQLTFMKQDKNINWRIIS